MNTFASNPADAFAENRALLWALIKDIRFGMFTARHADGHLHSRPMTTQNTSLDEDDSLWFFMSNRSDPVADLAAEPVVNVAYTNPASAGYVSASGLAAVIHDPAKVRQLWSPAAQAWFPGGVGDPDLALVQVRISHAHYWNIKAGRVSQLLRLARPAMTGAPVPAMGEQAEISMG